MISIAAIAALGGATAMAATAVATGDASMLVHATGFVPPGLHVALSHVPQSSHAYQVLSQHLSDYAKNGGVGAASSAGAAAVAKKGVAHGLLSRIK
jgi:hypothetical protein